MIISNGIRTLERLRQKVIAQPTRYCQTLLNLDFLYPVGQNLTLQSTTNPDKTEIDWLIDECI